MLGRQDVGGWVEEAWETPDPDVVADSMEILATCPESPVWQYFLEMDPVELEKMSRYRKIALARYGRQSLFQWDDIEVNEIRSWYVALKGLLDDESALQGTSENS